VQGGDEGSFDNHTVVGRFEVRAGRVWNLGSKRGKME
jgi:hypothetical protein